LLIYNQVKDDQISNEIIIKSKLCCSVCGEKIKIYYRPDHVDPVLLPCSGCLGEWREDPTRMLSRVESILNKANLAHKKAQSRENQKENETIQNLRKEIYNEFKEKFLTLMGVDIDKEEATHKLREEIEKEWTINKGVKRMTDQRAKWKHPDELKYYGSDTKYLVSRSEDPEDIFIAKTISKSDGTKFWFRIDNKIEYAIKENDSYLNLFMDVLLNTICSEEMMDLVSCQSCHNYFPDCTCV
jgi:sugar-specific transcriptional regulator TrmB